MTTTQALEKHNGLIHYWARKYQKSLDLDYDDVFQIAQIGFVRGWEQAPENPSETYQKNYAIRSVKNLLYGERQKQGRLKRAVSLIYLDCEFEGSNGTLLDQLPGPDDPKYDDNSVYIQAALLTLKPKDQRILKHVYFAGRLATEYADDEGITHQAASLRLKTALAKLKAAIPKPVFQELLSTR